MEHTRKPHTLLMPLAIRILLLVVGVAGQAGGQSIPGANAQAEALFQQAQEYHLGVNRPVDIQKALGLYLDVTRLNPRHRDAYYNLAGACFQHMRYDLAEKYYRTVIELDPKDGDAYNNLGSVYEKQGRTKHARRLYVKAIQVDSTVAVAHYNLARVLFNDGKHERALVHLELTIEYDPDNPVFVSQKARVEGEMGKISKTTVVLVVGVFVAGLATYAIVAAKQGGMV